MTLRTLLLLALWLPLPAIAHHQWAGIDLCKVRRDLVPPGLPAERLPAPQSTGARLLRRYCTQCHNLPGPGRHTAGEWPGVVARMTLLMEVSHRFGRLLGEVAVPTEVERRALLAYLGAHALRPWSGPQPPPEPYRKACSGCHALPDPGQHDLQAWPTVLARMGRNAEVMGRSPPSPPTMVTVREVLGLPPGALPTPPPPAHAEKAPAWGPWLALGPLLLLAVLGLMRWWRGANEDRRCVTR